MMKSVSENRNSINETLGLDKQTPAYKRAKVWVVAALVTILIAGGVIFVTPKNDVSLQYKAAQVQKGNLIVTVTATGELEPVNQVDVGTEVSGTIETVTVNHNDRVTAGQVLAKLDTDTLEAQVLKSQAALESARANLLDAQASTVEARNELKRLQHVHKLSEGKVPSRHDLDTAEAALKRAQAEEASAQAQISEAKATLRVDQTNLSKAVIRSPIDGIVLERKVEPGQTVAASLETPVMFILAEDLAQMELHVDVDEADVGQVKEGQEATFTVDAYPDRIFSARITEVRYAPQTEEGVVTYETLLSADNSDLSLRPGMTATADIIVKKVENATLVPNVALRFTPPEQEKQVSKQSRGLVGTLLPRPPMRSSSKKQQDTPTHSSKKHVWMLQNGVPIAISVTIGASDGSMTEVVAGKINPGMSLLVDIVRSGK
ncbi:MAG: efflux RND transporter periplasmic adaptor subunit [Desulfobacterales bacterium]|jgi:HlyD family secretion protein